MDGRTSRCGNEANITSRWARMEIVYILALLLKKCLSFRALQGFLCQWWNALSGGAVSDLRTIWLHVEFIM